MVTQGGCVTAGEQGRCATPTPQLSEAREGTSLTPPHLCAGRQEGIEITAICEYVPSLRPKLPIQWNILWNILGNMQNSDTYFSEPASPTIVRF